LPTTRSSPGSYQTTTPGSILPLILGIKYFSLATGAIIWVLSFLPVYAFNEYYFKQRMILRLEARMKDPEAEKKEAIL
jgi:hypothetical protein